MARESGIALPADQFVALQAAMSDDDKEELARLIDQFPPDSFDNLVMIQTRLGVMVMQCKVHPAIADAALRWFELAFTNLMVSKDKMPKASSKIEVNLQGVLRDAQRKAAGHLPAYTEKNDVWDATEAPLERILANRDG